MLNGRCVVSRLGAFAMALLTVAVLLCGILPFSASADAVTATSYIYFDLAAGNITISGSNYTGSIYKLEEDGTYTLTTVSGTLADGEGYYVFQSNYDSETGVRDGYFTETDGVKSYTIPTRTGVTYNGKPWGDYVTNNSDVEAVIAAWNTEAPKAGRTDTPYRIAITGKVNCELVIDNIWSSYHQKSTGRTTGGISFRPGTASASYLTLSMIGDNRVGNVYYETGGYSVHRMYFQEKVAGATLTVANLKSNSNENYWDSAIGASDSGENARGLVFNSGTIFAGTNAKDDCTAIGGGGNGVGVITINGGRITATVASSGAAIGGGIGKTSPGGQATVTITGGQVYAYNASCACPSSYTSYGVKYIPAAAIGGGSSGKNTCSPCTVTITGGYVYAQSVGGTAIGGGSSADRAGGDATIVIGGSAVVEAKSIAGTINGQNVPAGAAIGGGTGGVVGNGGNVTFTVKENASLKTGSIGGGSTTGDRATYKIGSANITITGGNISGQFIMAEGASQSCTFKMSGGVIDNDSRDASFIFLEENGGAIYMDDSAGNATLSGGVIRNCTAQNGGAIYMTAGKFYLQNTGKIEKCSAALQGGAVYMGGGESYIQGGFLTNNTAVDGGGLYLANGMVSISGGEVRNNTATQYGGAVYMGGGTLEISNGTVSNNTAVDGGAIYLANGEMSVSGGEVSNNTATQNGGAVYMGGGTLEISGGTVSNNGAVDGGAIYLASGEMSVSGGALTNNTATNNGGGAFLGGGTLTLNGGAITYNKATQNGAGAYVDGGALVIRSGQLEHNTAYASGGGAYVSGGNVTVTGGSVSQNTATVNGGGLCVNNGNVTVGGGAIDRNVASTGAGGGIYVSAEETEVYVNVFSGSISYNQASTSGGALAVIGTRDGNEKISVVIGANVEHVFGADGVISDPREHEHDGETYTHTACPVITSNTSVTSGGAIYVTGASGKSNLVLYCLIESGNDCAGDDEKSNFMMIDGGSILVSSQNGENTNCGHVEVHNTIHVTGGQVTLTGSMDNILLLDDATIEITDNNDFYNDHRTEGSKYYKLEYFENFKDPVTGAVTGRYIAYQLVKGEEHLIEGVMYSHEGWQIIGWADTTNGTQYAVGSTYDGSDGSLKLYAVWKINGYLVIFDPGVNLGDSYTGTVDPINGQYNVELTIPENGFFYKGHIFIGWVGDDGTEYNPGDTVVNLTLVDGATVTMTALWVECDHNESNPDYTVVYTYTASGNVITLECSCKGFSETATVKASNATFDTHTHSATVQYSGSNWGLSDEDIVYTKSGSALTGKPINAGEYAASITFRGATATVVYTIFKADQMAPARPTFVLEGNTLTVLSPLDPAVPSGLAIQYQLVYYTGSTVQSIPWQTNTVFTMPTAYTSYYICAKFIGDDNYNESPVTQSDAIYFVGTVEIKVVLGDGITHTLVENPDISTDTVKGLQIDVAALMGYYLNSDFSITVDNAQCAVETVTERESYLITNIPDNSKLIITISGASLKAAVSAGVAAGEHFDAISGSDALILRDSAFTACFDVLHYSGYTGLSVEFSHAVPAKTTLILIDRTNGTYWYCITDASVTRIALTAFTQMGGDASFTNVNGSTLSYQLVVNFARTDSGCTGSEFSMTLYADKQTPTDTCIPAFSTLATSVTVNMKDISLGIVNQSTTEGVDKDLLIDHSTSNAVASKWENRAWALVLKTDAVLPADARIKIVEGTQTTVHYPRTNGVFILPLHGESNALTLTLLSDIMDLTGGAYTFTVQLIASESLVGSASMNGDVCATTTLTFTSTPVSPSLKIEGDTQVYAEGSILSVDVTFRDVESCTITAIMMFKADEAGNYSSTAWTKTINHDEKTSVTLEIDLSIYDPNSYCLIIEVSDFNGTKLLQVPYYFVIQ
ncbi:MAG: hypothetical protein IJW29_04050 [Clostridia bacterium]|nr:hypothetical protein [Clostridia bacterium]